VPHDLSISGFNNQDICAMTTPGLTSVDQQIAPTVAAAAKLILEQLNGPARRRPVLRTIVPELVARGSTGPAPV
jgi:DNA-binding LacI/PurR family transcriptional regulator